MVDETADYGYQEYDLMEGSFGNGFVDGILSPYLTRLLRVFEYLDQTRPQREQVAA